ncbi:DNA polymerase III, gamma subunit-related protein [Thermosipho africanus TCF52B]|jgi:DNA polymerase-3 subunit delta'|uniref:DNA polymerase III, gamma subunit-related protein n=1 Tax=Thermosipho africanus (strain TCF52B) TaxID=484019 RepID=B7IF34_THEAB|nr:DNA polymerase III subunit delta' [Thermosipho africanus]ACJ74698.1 DNA polymerase III, gamma subunit-related protein [Thermosipho africanus TCF52B]MDK2900220.1 polymerase subunit delta [Thermosipho sp. (in: thermotogales)]
MEKIRKLIENNSGNSIAIVGENKRYVNDKVMQAVLDVTNYDIQRYLMIDENNIKIDHVRNIQEFLSFSSDKGKKIVVILNAEKMLPEAENALLKTLEEPPSYSLIVLTTTNWKALYPTIRSRLQKYYVSVPKDILLGLQDFILKKLAIEFPDKVDEIKANNLKIVEIENFEESPSYYYSLYLKIKENLEDAKKINNFVASLSSIKDFNFLKVLSKIALWICEEFSCDYKFAKVLSSILSSKVANYNYELTYYFILLSLNDAIKQE